MLTLADLKLGLHDLFEKRSPDLLRSKAGKYHAPILAEQRDAIDTLPPTLTGGIPLAGEIEALDDAHDGFGAAIYFTTEVYLRLPQADPDTITAAKRIRDAFIPELGELGASYVTEAERAMQRRPLLKSMKADLKRFPMADGSSLLEVATSFIDAGEALHHKLSERADKSLGNRKAAARIRSSSVGALNRLREDIARELERDPALPRDLDALVFGYFDTLAAMHAPRPARISVLPGEPPPPQK